jgi:hypothetical protein
MGGTLKHICNSNSLSISSFSFTNCKCKENGYGGAVYLDLEISPSSFTLSSLLFSSNGPETAVGKDVFVQGVI